MAITFRGKSSNLNKETKSRNSVGFQDKSAAGDRQGIGGEDVSLKQAIGSFNKRNDSPAKKIGPQGLGVKGNNGYSIGSPAKKSCSPITQRSKSPLKMNEALVAGAKNTNKEFLDVGAVVGGALNQPDKKAEGKTADLAPKTSPPKKEAKTVDAPEAKGINTDLGASTDMDLPTLTF